MGEAINELDSEITETRLEKEELHINVRALEATVRKLEGNIQTPGVDKEGRLEELYAKLETSNRECKTLANNIHEANLDKQALSYQLEQLKDENKNLNINLVTANEKDKRLSELSHELDM